MASTQKIPSQLVHSKTYLCTLADAKRYLAACDRTEAQVRRRLASEGHQAAEIDAVVERLLNDRMLNDVAYADRYVEKHLQQRLKAIVVVEEELRTLGITDEILEQVIAPFDDEQEEAGRAWRLVERSWSRWAQLPIELMLRRVSSYLVRRGYRADIVADICDRCAQRANYEDAQ